MPEDDISCAECYVHERNVGVGEHEHCLRALAEDHEPVAKALEHQGESSGLADPGVQVLRHHDGEEEPGLCVFEGFCRVTNRGL